MYSKDLTETVIISKTWHKYCEYEDHYKCQLKIKNEKLAGILVSSRCECGIGYKA